MTYIDGAEYLRRFDDVAKAGRDPLWHYLTFGRDEKRNVLVDELATPPVVPPIVGEYTISNIVGNSSLIIRATSNYAGAIDSLIWAGKEFVSRTCTGDLLQSASFFDNLGGDYNPTEAGSTADARGPSTSILKSISAVGNVLETVNQMAFWKPFNGAKLSGHILSKKVTIGHPASAHIIEYLVNFYISEAHTQGIMEAVTGYMPIEFIKFWGYNPSTMQITPLSSGPGEQSLPVIFSTEDGNYAMGAYSPDLPDVNYPNEGYGRFVPPAVEQGMTKWNIVFRPQPVPVGNYSYRCYIMVGNLENVKVSMTQLYNYLKGGVAPPYMPPVVTPVTPPVQAGLPSDFDAAAYMAYHEDVREANKTNPQMTAEYHYLTFGYKENRWPLPGAVVSSGSWPPPTTKGLHHIVTRAGQFFMSGLRTPEGLLIGTYGLDVPALLLSYDGTLKQELSLVTESVYSLYMPPDGLPVFTTEYPANVFKRSLDGMWKNIYSRSEYNSLAGEIMPVKDGIAVLTASGAGNDGCRIWKGDVNGNNWHDWINLPGVTVYTIASDGNNLWMGGHEGNLPVIYDQNKQRILAKDNALTTLIAQMVVGDGLFSLGMNSLDAMTPSGPRAAWFNNFDGNGSTDDIEIQRPYIMDMLIHPVTKVRYAIASVWRETNFPTSQLLHAPDGWHWKELTELPMPFAHAMFFGDGGIYIVGGKWAEYGAVYFYKF